MIDIESFRQIAFQANGFQRLSRYRVRVPVPAALAGGVGLSGTSYQETSRYMEYWVSSADLPGSFLLTQNVNRFGYGPSEKKPGAPAFNDIMLTIYNDGKNDNLTFFNDWMSTIINHDYQNSIADTNAITGASTYEISYKPDYAVDMDVALFDQTDTLVYQVLLREAYPVAIPETKLVAQPQPTVMQITVLLTYFDWRLLSTIISG